MSIWATVLAAAGLAFLTKLAGYVVPQRWFDHPHLARVVALLPVALLAALVATQTFAGPGGTLTLDARAAAVAVAVIAFALRAPFLLVVVLAAGVAAALRGLGWA